MPGLTQTNGTRWSDYVPLAALLAGCAACYRSVLDGYFLADDFGYIQLYSRIGLPRFPALFIDDWSQGIWGFNLHELRPLVGFTYWLEYRLWGVDPFGYHLTNLLLYMLAVAGFWFFVRESARVFLGPRGRGTAIAWLAAVAGLIFMLHPAHVEGVAWIAGRTDLLGACAYLWSMYCLARYWSSGHRGWASAGIAIYACGVFMKENVVTLPASFVLFALLGGVRHRVKGVLGVVAALSVVAALWTLLRYVAFGAVSSANWTDFVSRVPYYTAQILPISRPLSLAAGFVLAATMIAAVFVNWRQAGRTILYWCIGWPVIHALPLIAVHYESPRHVFLVLAGPIAAGVLAALILTKRSWLLAAPLLVIALLLSRAFWDQDTEQLAHWNRSSAYSRQLSTLLDNADYDATSIVLFNSSPNLPVWFWQWALPFALEEPFMDFRARFVAKPDWYCCSSWSTSKEDLLKEVEGGTPLKLHTVDFDEAAGRFVSR